MIFYCFLLFLIGVVNLALRQVVRNAICAAEDCDVNIAPGIRADIAIYRNQMSEIETDRKHGLLDKESASEARLELARRFLLAAKKKSDTACDEKKRTSAFRLFLILAILFVPLFSLGIYLFIGSAGIPSRPFSMFLAREQVTLDDAEKIVLAEVMASRNSEDGRLSDDLTDLYLAAGRFQDAVNAGNRAIVMNGEDARRMLRYAIALTGFDGGVISQESESAFRKAAQLDPKNPDARIFLARGLIQSNKKEEAVRLLEDFLQTVPDDEPWRKDLAYMIANMHQQALTEAEIRSDIAVTTEQRRLIAANAGKLAARLEKKPDDLQDWMMMINARLVIHEFNAALEVFEKGLDMLPANKKEKLAAFAREKGLISRSGQMKKTVDGENR